MAACSGLMAGFLTFATVEADGFEGLFGNIDIFAANSGGSWYAVNTLYSAEIPEMQEEMAASPSEAGTIYNNKFTLKTVGLRRRLSQEILPPVSSAVCPVYVDAYGGVPQADVIFNAFIGLPTSMPDAATLSLKPHNTWADGKVLLVSAALPTPGSDDDDHGRVWVHFTTTTVEGLNGSTSSEFNGSISYRARSMQNTSLPRWTPVKFSFRLGDAPDAEAPVPFCADADCHGLLLEYVGFSADSGESFSALSPPLGEIIQSAFVEGAGSLPLGQVVGASNSAAGTAIIDEPLQGSGGLPLLGSGLSQCIELVTWADGDSWGNPFSSEDSQITQELISDTAGSGLMGLVDGAWTDNTGVASSLAAMTSAGGCSEPRDLRVSAMLTGPDVPFGLLALFPGANITLGPVCSSPTQSDVLDLMANSDFVVPPFNALHLTSIKYGTIQCETADNPWYGVKAGLVIGIHFIWVVTPLGIQPTLEDFFAHGVLAGEIVQTMAHHNETLMDVAEQIFGKGSESTSPTSSTDAAADSATWLLFPHLPLVFSLSSLLRFF